jgi:hypothetical protein
MGGSRSGRWGSSKPFAEGLAHFNLADCPAEVIAAAHAGPSARDEIAHQPRRETSVQVGHRVDWEGSPAAQTSALNPGAATDGSDGPANTP